jgi:hypothetical protein
LLPENEPGAGCAKLRRRIHFQTAVQPWVDTDGQESKALAKSHLFTWKVNATSSLESVFSPEIRANDPSITR